MASRFRRRAITADSEYSPRTPKSASKMICSDEAARFTPSRPRAAADV